MTEQRDGAMTPEHFDTLSRAILTGFTTTVATAARPALEAGISLGMVWLSVAEAGLHFAALYVKECLTAMQLNDKLVNDLRSSDPARSMAWSIRLGEIQEQLTRTWHAVLCETLQATAEQYGAPEPFPWPIEQWMTQAKGGG